MLPRLDLIGVDVGKINASPDHQVVPEYHQVAVHSMLLYIKQNVQQVGFLPVLPHPITKYEALYKSLRNFHNILGQLDQNNFAIFCDEGVYHVARKILLKKPGEFKGLILCLGSFHL